MGLVWKALNLKQSLCHSVSGSGGYSRAGREAKNDKDATLRGKPKCQARVVGVSDAKHDWTSELKSRLLERGDA